MENLALLGLVENLKPAMTDVVIRRVIQHHPSGFIFQTRSQKLPSLKVVIDTQNPALYPSEARPPADVPSSDFLMVLRKHFTSAELVGFTKPLGERILEFVFKTAVPTKELETVSLVVELIPNAPNLILLDAERCVLTSFLPITPQHGIGEYEPYSFPTSGGKVDLERALKEDVSDLVSEPQSLISRIAGIGPAFAAEIVFRHKKSGKPLIEELRSIVDQVRSPSKAAWLYTDLPLGHILETNDLKRLRKAIVSPVELESLGRTHSARGFANITEACRFFFDEMESRSLLEQAKMPVLRDMRSAAKRLSDKEKRLQREQKKYEEAEGLQRTAQLLTSSGLKMDLHYASVSVKDYFNEKPKQVQVPLDESISLRENIERMFKRHAKAGRGRGLVAQQLSQIVNRKALIYEQTRRLEAIKDWDTWFAVASKIAPKQASAGRPEPSADSTPRRIKSVQLDGHDVLVGRSSRENDELTFDIAAPEDFWFHVADYSGSHVVVRNPAKERDLNQEVLVKAAQLAAYFSQARNSSKVEVHYTKRKHVSKPRRAKAGLVKLNEFKSIKVEPKNWLLKAGTD